MKTKTIRDSVTIAARPSEVYEAILDPKKHSKFSGARAKISRKVGGVFSAYDSYITGKILELKPGKKIVLSLRFEEEHWAEDHYSRAMFQLSRTKTGTRLDFTQTGVPEQHYADISEGWKEFYWQPIKAMLEKK